MKTKLLILSLIALFAIDSFAKDTKKEADTVKTPTVVVTALRYPEKIYEVPLSITPISKSELHNYIGNGFDNALSAVPGVLSQSRSGTPDMRITIRGFGSRGAGDRSNSGTTRGIKVILDGIPETEPDGRTSFDNIDMAFVNSMEVIRSNASSVWGNAAGGVISINTMPENSDDFLVFNSLSGSYGLQKFSLSGYTNLGSGGLAANFSTTKFDGYRQNSQGDKKTGNIRFRGLLGDNTLFNAVITGGDNEYYIPGALTQEQFDNTPEIANPTYLKRQERRHNRTLRIGLGIDHNFDESNSVSAMAFANPKFLQRSERNTFRDFTRYHIGGNFSYKNEMSITDEIKNIALAGFDESYQDGAILFYSLSDTQGRGVLQESKSEGANSFGAYLQDEIVFGEHFSVLIGARYDNVTYYSEAFFQADEENLLPAETRHFERLTPKAAISYRFTPHHSVYLSLGGGVEVPAGNETNPSADQPNLQINSLLEPIISTTYELGSKQLIDLENDGIFNYIKYDAALYMIQVQNELVPYADGKFFFSAGETQRFGAELAFEAKALDMLYLNCAFTYMNGKYNEYLIDSSHFDPELYAGKTANYKDNKIAGNPDMFYNISFKIAPQDFFNLFAEVSMQGVGKYFADDANKYEVPSYNILNLGFGMDDYFNITDFAGIRVFGYINNLTDEKYAASSFINPSLDKTTKAAMFLEPGLPTNYGIGVSLRVQ